MCHQIFLRVGLALVVVGSLLAGSASAALITIANPSFQSPVRADGLDGVATSWVKDTTANGQAV